MVLNFYAGCLAPMCSATQPPPVSQKIKLWLKFKLSVSRLWDRSWMIIDYNDVGIDETPVAWYGVGCLSRWHERALRSVILLLTKPQETRCYLIRHLVPVSGYKPLSYPHFLHPLLTQSLALSLAVTLRRKAGLSNGCKWIRSGFIEFLSQVENCFFSLFLFIKCSRIGSEPMFFFWNIVSYTSGWCNWWEIIHEVNISESSGKLLAFFLCLFTNYSRIGRAPNFFTGKSSGIPVDGVIGGK